MPDRPPKSWFDKTSESVKQSLKDAHPDWSEETLDERTRMTVGDVWYNKLSPQKKQEIMKQYEGESYSREDFRSYDSVVATMESDISDVKNAYKVATADAVAQSNDLMDETDVPTDDSVPDNVPLSDQLDRKTDSDQDRMIPEAAEDRTPELKYKKKEGQVPLQKGVVDQKDPIQDQIGGGDKEPDADDKLEHKDAELKASKKDGLPQFLSVPAYRTPYVAAPKFGGKEGEILIKAIVLEEDVNVNGWRVVKSEFPKVAEQYQAGRQLRINHSKDMEHVIGKSFKASVLKGDQVEQYMGSKIEGINPKGLYVAAEFEANPHDGQVRTNILQGYVETGSIGLDAEAFCDECMKPIKVDDEGKMDRTCRHYESPIQLRNVEVKEYSYVAEPAFSHSIAVPSFGAAVQSLADRLVRDHKASSLSQTIPDGKQLALKAESEGRRKAEGDSDADADADADAEAKLKLYRKGYSDALADAAKFRAVDVPPQKPGNIHGDADAEGGPGFAPMRGDADAEGEGDAEGESESEADAGVSAPPPFNRTNELKDTPRTGSPSAVGPGGYKDVAVPNPEQTHPVQGTARRRTDQIARTGTMRAPVNVSRDQLLARVLRPTETGLKEQPWITELFVAAAEHPQAPAWAKRMITKGSYK